MENTLYITLSRQTALRREMDTVANNIANMSTVGFQSQTALFTHYLHDEAGEYDVHMANDMGAMRNTRPGPLMNTGNALDLAIEGEGYFIVQTDAGPAYTRAGSFMLGPEGEIVTADGNPLVGLDQAPIVIPQALGPVQISLDGVISAGEEPIGVIDVVRFDREQEMERLGGVLLTTDEAPQRVEQVRVHQGMLEGSNVQSISEITRLIEIQRAYESAASLTSRDGDAKDRMIQTLTSQN